MPISTSLIDVDFESVVPEAQTLGALIESNELMSSGVDADDYERTAPMIPRSDWDAWAEKMWPVLVQGVRYVHNQGREGSCVGNGIAGATEVAGFLQYGERWWRRLSPMSLYERIGRSSSSGAYIPDGINEAATRGILPADVPENAGLYPVVYPETGFNPRRLARLDWTATAADWKSHWLRCNTVEAIFSALMRGKPVVVGRQSHCIYYIAAVKDRGSWYFAYVNSWSMDWGDPVNSFLRGGLGYDSERTASRLVGYACEGVRRRKEIPVPKPPGGA